MAARNLFRNRSSFKGLNWNLASPRLGSARESRFKVQSPFSTGVTVEFHRVHSAGKIISSRELLIFSKRAPPSCGAIHMCKIAYNVQSTRPAKPAKYIFCTISMFFHATDVIITRFQVISLSTSPTIGCKCQYSVFAFYNVKFIHCMYLIINLPFCVFVRDEMCFFNVSN